MYTPEDSSTVACRLLLMPYDIRFTIYQHLFPRNEQIYVQALESKLHVMLPEDNLPVNVFRVCRQLHNEAGSFLYNSYLYNIVGTKADCLANYRGFLRTLRKHARSEVSINAFSNGEHSSTMCLSLQAGDAKMGVLSRRRRGEPKTVQELVAEQSMAETLRHTSFISAIITRRPIAIVLLGALLVAAFAWMVSHPMQ